MTTPGGVPNLPTGALTLDTLASKTQDMTPTAMRARAAERIPSTFDSSTGGNALNDNSPFGFLTQLFAGFNSFVANADPANIQGPEDLPGLLTAFIESLPVIGPFVTLGEAIAGTYTGDDATLLEVQTALAPIRDIFSFLLGNNVGAGTLPHLPAPAVSDTILNPQPVPGFPNLSSMQQNIGAWSYDTSVSYNGSGGSPKVVADGNLQAMAGVVLPVQPQQIIAVPDPVIQWASFSSPSGTYPIQLQLVPYSGSEPNLVAGTPIVLAELRPTTVVQSTWAEALVPVTNLSGVVDGSYTIPASGVTRVQVRMVLTADAAAGSTVWWNNCNPAISGGFLATLDAGLNQLRSDSEQAAEATNTLIQSIATAIQNYTDGPTFIAAWNAAWSTWWTTETTLASDESFTIQQILKAALGIDPATNLFPPTQMSGWGGLATIEDTFSNLATQLSTSIAASLDVAVTDLENVPGMAQLLNLLGVISTNAHGLATDTAGTVANVNNRPIMGGLDDTAESNMAYLSATTPITLLAPTSHIAFVRCSQVDTKGSISFTAEQGSSTPPTGMHVTLYKVDFANLQLVPITSTAFVTAQLTLATEAMLFAGAGQTPVAANDVLAVEWQSLDISNPLTLFGQAVSKPNHPVAKLPAFGATRSAGTGAAPTSPIPFSALTFSNNNLPYVGFETTNPPPPIFFPEQTPYYSDGVHTPETWANFVDLAIVANGGGGQGETGAGNGDGGTGGTWDLLTLAIDTSGPNGLKRGTGITFSGLNNPGAGGPFFTPGQNGGNVAASWVDASNAPQSVTVPGGAGGQPSTNLTSWGLGPGSRDYQGYHYTGGATNVVGGVGNPPGGGGTGGAAFQFGFAGANGRAWAVDRQT